MFLPITVNSNGFKRTGICITLCVSLLVIKMWGSTKYLYLFSDNCVLFLFVFFFRVYYLF